MEVKLSGEELFRKSCSTLQFGWHEYGWRNLWVVVDIYEVAFHVCMAVLAVEATANFVPSLSLLL